MEYRIDDLARQAETTVRNVRAYQERGLLAAPKRVGRVAIYDDGHLARLRLILGLLDRGVTLQLIGDLVEAWEDGRNLGELLGLEAALLAPWSDDHDTTTTREDLVALFDSDFDDDRIEQAVRLGIIEPDGDRYKVLSPRLVQIGADLVQMGVPLSAMLGHVDRLRDQVTSVASEFVDLAMTHVFADLVRDMDQVDLTEATEVIQRLRPLAKAAVDVELSRAMEQEITARITDVMQLLGRRPS